MKQQLYDIRIAGYRPLISPRELKARIPQSAVSQAAVARSRKMLEDILVCKDNRKFVVVGPCSIHDVDEALEYARRLSGLAVRVQDELLLVMRTYFEKPRTSVGWKGLISDPHLDDSFEMEEGLSLARKLSEQAAELGVPTATEFLSSITPQYLADLIAWTSVGARTTESQTHREMASGLSMPVGFKNSTDGDVDIAINAIKAARLPHSFLGINEDGVVCTVQTKGNQLGHLILRGGNGQPNYDPANVRRACEKLSAAGVPPGIVVDCSHDNSGKRHEEQPRVFDEVVRQALEERSPILGMMLESYLEAGNQPLTAKKNLKSGVSVTDKCMDWRTTERLILDAHARFRKQRKS
jgi:3-deoxy-7-phosphoheptulonate synthase